MRIKKKCGKRKAVSNKWRGQHVCARPTRHKGRHVCGHDSGCRAWWR